MTPELLERWFKIAMGNCADDIPYNVQYAAFRDILDRALGKPIAINADLDQMKDYDRMSSKELKRMILEQFGPELLELQAQALAQESDSSRLTHLVAGVPWTRRNGINQTDLATWRGGLRTHPR